MKFALEYLNNDGEVTVLEFDKDGNYSIDKPVYSTLDTFKSEVAQLSAVRHADEDPLNKGCERVWYQRLGEIANDEGRTVEDSLDEIIHGLPELYQFALKDYLKKYAS